MEIILFIPSHPLYNFKWKQVSYCDIIDTWAARLCDVMLTDYSDAVSIDAFITMTLLARDVSAWCFIVAAFIAVYCFIFMVE